MPYQALKNCVLTSPESLYMLVNLVTVFVRSVRMGCNVAGLYDMTQTPNCQRVREERIQQRINARTDRIDTELLPV